MTWYLIKHKDSLTLLLPYEQMTLTLSIYTHTHTHTHKRVYPNVSGLAAWWAEDLLCLLLLFILLWT
jgi:hypothetical protein